MSVRIVGTGSYMPPHIITSEEIEDFLRVKTGGWIKRHLGIEARHFTGPLNFERGSVDCRMSSLDISARAAMEAMKNANMVSEDIDVLVYVSCTQDPEQQIHFSAAGMALHHTLELASRADLVEIDSGCAGMVQAVHIANSLIQGGAATTVLAVAENNPCGFVDRDLYLAQEAWLSICIFGAGASALVLQGSSNGDGRGILGTYCGADSNFDLMNVDRIKDKLVYRINARTVKESYPILMMKAIEGLREKVRFSLDEEGLVIAPHQANLHLLQGFTKQFGINWKNVLVNVDRKANLSAATTAALIHQGVSEGAIREGTRLLLCSVGAGGRPGAHYGAALIRW